MTRGRRVAVAAALSVIAVVLGVGIALPSLVRREVIARAEARGWRCELEDVDVGLDSLTLHGLRVESEARAIRAWLQSLVVRASLFELLTGGAAAIHAIEASGGEVELDAARERASADSPRDAESAARARPEIAVRDVAVVVRDAHGELVRAATISGRVGASGEVELEARELSLAPTGREAVTVARASLRGNASGTLEQVRAEGVVIEVRDAGGEDAGLFARLRGARANVAGGDSGEEPAALGAGAEVRAFASLSDDFDARIEQLTVRRVSSGAPRDVLTELEVGLTRVDGATFRTQGEGSPDHGGRLGWDLRVEPLALRAVGSIELRDVALAVLEPVLPDALPLYRPEDARLDGELRIEGAGDALHATGRLAVRELAVSSPRIAPEPVRANPLELEGEATFRPEQRRLEIARLRLTSGPAHADVEGAIEWAPDHYLFDLRAVLPATRCNDAIAAIPRDLLQEMQTVSLDGTLGGRLELRVDSRDLEATVLTIRVADGCEFQMVPPLADLTRFETPFAHRVEEPDGTIFEMTTGPGSEAWTPISEISPFMLHAALGHEDAGFFRHAGFSTGAIREALVRNLREGRYVMGASTISMQLVKNVFLRREKTLARKVQEVLLTWWIESAWPKERILELYLNVIEYGPSVYGIRNASRHYFGVEPSELSPAQSAYLASILPSPKLYHSHWEQGALPASWVNRLTRFVRLLGERGRYDATAVDEGVREIEAFRFHRPGDPEVPVRTFEGRTTPLPISGQDDEANAVLWDEALDGALAEDSAGEYE